MISHACTNMYMYGMDGDHDDAVFLCFLVPWLPKHAGVQLAIVSEAGFCYVHFAPQARISTVCGMYPPASSLWVMALTSET